MNWKSGEPLGLPRGSVRGVLALMIVGATCGSYLLTGAAPDGLLALAGSAVTYYFVQREVQTAGQPVEPELPTPAFDPERADD